MNILPTYKKLCAQFYDLEDHRDSKASISFFMDYAIKSNGAILEPMCGAGRFLIPMLEKNLDAYGFDASQEMLDILKQKYLSLKRESKAPVWHDFIQNFKTDKLYNLIFIPYGSLGLVTDINDLKKALKNIYNHLSKDGKFVFEIETVASVPEKLGIWLYRVRKNLENCKIALNSLHSYNSESQIFKSICRYDFIENNQIQYIENEVFTQYLFRFDEMDQLLLDAGFIKIKKFQDYNKTEITDLNVHTIIYECII